MTYGLKKSQFDVLILLHDLFEKISIGTFLTCLTVLERKDRNDDTGVRGITDWFSNYFFK